MALVHLAVVCVGRERSFPVTLAVPGQGGQEQSHDDCKEEIETKWPS